MTAILHTLRNNVQLIQALDEPVGGRRFIYRLAGCCFRYMEQWLGPTSQTDWPEARRDASFAFLAGGSGSVIEWWLRGGMKESPEEIAALICALSESVVNGLPN